MIMTNKLLPVALIAALIGGSVGAFVMSRNSTTSAETQTAKLDTARNLNREPMLKIRRLLMQAKMNSSRRNSKLLPNRVLTRMVSLTGFQHARWCFRQPASSCCSDTATRGLSEHRPQRAQLIEFAQGLLRL